MTEQGLAQSEVAKRLKLSNKTLSTWVLASKAGKLKAIGAKRIVPVSPMEAELSRLKKQVAFLREERDILKKATAFFAKQSR